MRVHEEGVRHVNPETSQPSPPATPASSHGGQSCSRRFSGFLFASIRGYGWGLTDQLQDLCCGSDVGPLLTLAGWEGPPLTLAGWEGFGTGWTARAGHGPLVWSCFSQGCRVPGSAVGTRPCWGCTVTLSSVYSIECTQLLDCSSVRRGLSVTHRSLLRSRPRRHRAENSPLQILGFR